MVRFHLAILLVLFLLVPTYTHALGPFGGRLLEPPIPCGGGLFLKVGPPVPGVFVWQTGIPYLYNPPSHAGQWILGIAGPNTISCPPPASAAPGIIINGTSL